MAFYLPQFHTIPENDRWWGRGFTDWVNVAKARPLFANHYQPHVPADLGYYDLRQPEARDAQARLARKNRIFGFCYYHYWFGGKRLLHIPFDEVLGSGEPDLPFCLCWANENWTRRWDGRDREILIAQQHSVDDDRDHIDHLLQAFRNPRYIKIDGRPLFLVYRTELLPDPAQTAQLWRDRARAAGLPGLYLTRVESFSAGMDPAEIGFDAAVEFAPDWGVVATMRAFPADRTALDRFRGMLHSLGLLAHPLENLVFQYDDLADRMLSKPPVGYRRFRCVTPSWDNTARRARGAYIFHGSTPERYEAWLTAVVDQALRTHPPGERLVFVNAWNEWAEGNHLEPDQRWGRAYLDATARAVAPSPLRRSLMSTAESRPGHTDAS